MPNCAQTGKCPAPSSAFQHAKACIHTLNGDTYIGIEVTKALRDDIAGNAGRQAGDFVTAIIGKPVSAMNHYSAYIHDLPITTTSTFEVVRDGKKETLTFDLASAAK